MLERKHHHRWLDEMGSCRSRCYGRYFRLARPLEDQPADAREQIYRAATPRECRHALWLLSQGSSAAQVARALECDPHTIDDWLSAFAQEGPPPSPSSKVVAPHALQPKEQATLKAAIEGAPRAGSPASELDLARRAAVRA